MAADLLTCVPCRLAISRDLLMSRRHVLTAARYLASQAAESLIVLMDILTSRPDLL